MRNDRARARPSRALLTVARRKAGRRGVKIHRNYTVEEVAWALGIAKVTVRRWIKKGLPAITDRKPALILGSDLVDYIAKPCAPRQRCHLHECYCVKCRAPRRPDGDMAEFVPGNTTTIGNLRVICPACGTLMHKRVRRDALEPLRAILDLTFAPAP